MANNASEHLVAAFHDRFVNKKTEAGLEFKFEEEIHLRLISGESRKV